MTRGIVVVTLLAAPIAGVPAVRMTSTLRRTSSAANSGRRSNFPSAQRDSMTRFLPPKITQVTQARPQRFHPACVAGSGGGTQETDPNDLRRLRLSHNSTEGECERDSEDPPPIVDFRF